MFKRLLRRGRVTEFGSNFGKCPLENLEEVETIEGVRYSIRVEMALARANGGAYEGRLSNKGGGSSPERRA